MIIAIDGPAGSGKSTTARAVARRLGMAHLDSGALYRAVTLAALEGEVPLEAGPMLARAEERALELIFVDGQYRVFMDGVDASDRVRSKSVTDRVSAVAAIGAVRDWVNARIRTAAAQHRAGVVADGRDIGTVVFPHADLKIFLTASIDARARRQADGTGTEDEGALRQLIHRLLDRDEADSTRAVAPLARAADAVDIDTTGLTVEAQVERVVALARGDGD